MCNLIILVPILNLIGLGILGLIAYELLGPSKARKYRQDLSDMYVVGKIKQIAKKEGLDLNAEFAEFAKITKNKKIDYEALDSTVERNLQEKLSEKSKAATKE